MTIPEAEALLSALRREYPNDIRLVKTEHQLIEARAQQEIIDFVQLLIQPKEETHNG